MAVCACGCGQETRVVRRKPNKFVYHHSAKGAARWNWTGGRYNHPLGYIEVYNPTHHRANVRGKVFEHILVAERALGRPLPRRVQVHHVDGNKANNSPTNLVVCENHAYHALLHKRMRARDACGDANAARCGFCHRYDRQGDIRGRDVKQQMPYHLNCYLEWRRARKAKEASA